ncbi:MAG: hypothetical protein ACQEXJ_21480 [Myxococcota bacterium]
MSANAPFAPFRASEQGDALVLDRPRSLGVLAWRTGLWGVLLALAGLMALIPYAAITHGAGVTDRVLAVALFVPLWLVFRLVLLGFRMEGVSRIEARPDGLVVSKRGALRPDSTTVSREDLEAVTVRGGDLSSGDGVRRWVQVWAQRRGGPDAWVYLGWLHGVAGEPAAEHPGVVALAERLGLPVSDRE